MTTKSPSRRQIIILIDNNNISKFISSSDNYITNINSALKNIKSEIMANFIYSDHYKLIITTNKVTSQFNLYTIENYIKNVNTIKFKDIMTFHLPQSKFYLKIMNIPYIMENTNILVNSSIVESIIKSTHIFNNILLTSKLRVIKALSKSNMAIIWIDI